jgi:hypothetical protein
MRAKLPPPQARKTEAQVLVGDSFERFGDLATQIEAFARQTSASNVGWPSPDDNRTGSLIVRLEYVNDVFLDMALQRNHRCPGEWGFFVTRVPAASQPPVPEDPAALSLPKNGSRRRGCRGHGRGGGEKPEDLGPSAALRPVTIPGRPEPAGPRLPPPSGRPYSPSSADSIEWYAMDGVVPAIPSLSFDELPFQRHAASAPARVLEKKSAPTLQLVPGLSPLDLCPEIPSLIVPQAHRTSRPAADDCAASAPRLCSLTFLPSVTGESCMSIPSLNGYDVARPNTAPPEEIPCRHTFIHYSSELTPTTRRQRSLSTPALPHQSREWDLDFARQTANVPLSRCATPKASESEVAAFTNAEADPETLVTLALPAALPQTSPRDSLDFALAVPEPLCESTIGATCSDAVASPGTPSTTPARKSPAPAEALESPARASPWKSTHRGSRGGRKTIGTKAGPVSPEL